MIKDMQDEAKLDASLMLNESIQKTNDDKKALADELPAEEKGFIGNFIEKTENTEKS